MDVMVVFPHIDYESFMETDSNPLESTQVFDVSSPELRRQALIKVLRQVADPYLLGDPGYAPKAPQIAVTELNSPRVKDLLAQYEAEQAAYAVRSAEAVVASQFFGALNDDVATDEQLEVWLESTIADSRSNGEPPRIYFKTVI